MYSLYCVGGFGFLYSLHSLRVFSTFRKITDIPDEFIKNHVKLRGVVESTFTEPPTLKKNVVQFKEQVQTYSPFEDPNKDFLPFANPFVEEDVSPLYLKVQHLPVFNLGWKRSSKIQTEILVKLAGIKIKKSYLNEITENLFGERIWFRILRHDNADGTLVCIVKLKGTWFENYNFSLVKLGYANVESYDESLHNVKYYKKMHKKLQKHKKTFEKSQRSSWFKRLIKKIGLFDRKSRK